VPFLGPPDEVDDYYHGPARSGTPFLREVFAASHLYKVSGGEVREHNDRETDVRAATADRDDGTPAR